MMEIDWDKVEVWAGALQRRAQKEETIPCENIIQDLANLFGFELVQSNPNAANQAEETVGFR